MPCCIHCKARLRPSAAGIQSFLRGSAVLYRSYCIAAPSAYSIGGNGARRSHRFGAVSTNTLPSKQQGNFILAGGAVVVWEAIDLVVISFCIAK